MWLHKRWQMIMSRCYAPWLDVYRDYGAKGIYVCQEWHDFDRFREWCEQQPEYFRSNHIDRIDNLGPYSPDNCRFVTPSENHRNKSSNVNLTAFGETKTVADWLEDVRCNATPSALYQRIRNGWDHIRAITEPTEDHTKRYLIAFGETKTWDKWLRDERCVVGKTVLIRRIDLGWEHERAITTPARRRRRQLAS